jgi:AbrB family looped-hinge helix DNA binding protein
MAQAKMATTTVSTKGQVILPKAIRDEKNWAPGFKLTAESTREGVLLRPERLFSETKFEDVRGCLDARGKHLKIEDFNKAIANEVKRRHARGRY